MESYKPPLPVQCRGPVDKNAVRGENVGRIAVSLLPSRSKRLCIEEAAQYFSVMYCVKKKNAKRDGPWFDGVMSLRGSKYELQNTEGKTFSKGRISGSPSIRPESVVEVGKFKIEVMTEVAAAEYTSGRIFSSVSVPLSFVEKSRANSASEEISARNPDRKRKFFQYTLGQDSLVLNAAAVALDGAAPVIVDPYIASKLRPHQKDGVKFMYECVAGIRYPAFRGCLLADEMGLGKTIQVIALFWTLLQQGPKGVPLLDRAIVVCPSSLVQNWGKEVRKWLGSERVKAVVVDSGLPSKEATEKLLNFRQDRFCSLLIISYECLRKHKDLISRPGLLICDEAHRLKNCAGNKTIESLLSLRCPRRILLTGTPVQNNLSEFYALMNFANPNLLGPLLEFKLLYATPIERSRDREADDHDRELGRCRAEELHRKTSFCILRRTSHINMQYLPPKTGYIVFCKPQLLQTLLYQVFIKSKFVRTLLRTETPIAHVLTAIGALRKLCNHPTLVENDMKYITIDEMKCHPAYDSISDMVFVHDGQVALRSGIDTAWHLSGKLFCLSQLLASSVERKDRVVIVSNFTQTLDLIQKMCDGNQWGWLRLDGTTCMSQRQPLIDRFNRQIGDELVFLLSSKAGGTGLNLVGANRIVLVDPDWNPATDAQAMARVWREGQKKPVIIYRLLTTGSIEEKIYQRQIMKLEITSVMEDQSTIPLGSSTSGRNFSRKELSELLALETETSCDTFDKLTRANTALAETWKDSSLDIEDEVLRNIVDSGVVTFVYKDVAAAIHEESYEDQSLASTGAGESL